MTQSSQFNIISQPDASSMIRWLGHDGTAFACYETAVYYNRQRADIDDARKHRLGQY